MSVFDNLFQEIGHTLEATSKEVIHLGGETLRQAVSRTVAGTTVGQQAIADVRNAEIGKMLPFIILGVLAIFLFGRMLR